MFWVHDKFENWLNNQDGSSQHDYLARLVRPDNPDKLGRLGNPDELGLPNDLDRPD